MTKIYIYDEIGGNGITALNVVDELSKAEGDLEVHINSGGGSVSQGIAIYNAIKQYDGQVVVYVDGLAASIASIIAMAGDKLIMAEGSLMMVHEVWTQLAGNASDLRKEAEVLDKHTDTILDIYEANTPLSRDEIQQMLAAETWLTADEALELGIADEIAGEAKLAASIDLSRFQNAPAAIENLIEPVALSMVPTQEMADVAAQALEWREEYGRGGTEVGVARARDIKNRRELSQDTVNRMISYFARHEVDKDAEGFRQGEDGFPSAGKIAWDLWGGDSGKAWAEARREDDSENYYDPEEDEEEMNSADENFVARLDAAKARLATLTKLAQL